ncbi:hypothetical protein [Burkholderia vietnamiensis]|uniref:hypothetical protein n=1 Tax=Burkholderia vietnamiensis TaxID=60552 RepID=UPI00158F373E|nr:hypothetical protein [Burkholderia vietnamiensis]
MATGDQNDFLARLKERIPSGWFGTDHPILDAVLTGIASMFASVYAAYAFMVAQTRIQTSTGGWLDLSAADYFGLGLPRLSGESDPAYSARIQINLVQERGTRNAVYTVLKNLTGRTPIIVEPQNPADTGAYGGPTIGYGVAGAYGSLLLSYQAFVTAYRPIGVGIPYIGGYGSSVSGYSQPAQGEYADLSQTASGVTDAAIYAAIESVRPAGTILWVRISN